MYSWYHVQDVHYNHIHCAPPAGFRLIFVPHAGAYLLPITLQQLYNASLMCGCPDEIAIPWTVNTPTRSSPVWIATRAFSHHPCRISVCKKFRVPIIIYLLTCHSSNCPSCMSTISRLIHCIAHHCVQAGWGSRSNSNVKLAHISIIFKCLHNQRRLLVAAEQDPVVYHHACVASHSTVEWDPLCCRVWLRGWKSCYAYSQTCISIIIIIICAAIV